MNQEKTQKVFIQFTYCPLCRSNHKKGKKHILTTRHQEVVNNVVKKFSRKIAEAKKSVDIPAVKDCKWSDADRKFWCYFCQSDNNCHKMRFTDNGDCIVEHGGMLEHIVREDHVKNTTSFLKVNRVDMKRTPEFILTSQEYINFLANAEKAISIFFKEKAQLLHQISSNIRVQSAVRRHVVAAALMEQSKQQLDKRRHVADQIQISSRLNHYEDGQRRKTAQAFGEGLTVVDRSGEDDAAGNIYTNALPPWMAPDAEDTEGDGQIGPTIKDLEKHRKLEKKAKLPATRVGARFDRSTDQSDSWMPSFGGVWHHTRRTDSVKRFQRGQFGKEKMSWKKSASHAQTSSLSTSVQDKGQFSDECVNDPSSLLSAEHYSPPKLPRTTATAPAPWNRYTSSTGSNNTGVEISFSSSSDSPPTNMLEGYQMASPGPIYHQQTRLTVMSEVHEESSLFQLTVKPYVSKRRKPNPVTSFHSESMSGSPSMSGQLFGHQYHQPYNLNNPFEFQVNHPTHTVPYHQPNGYSASGNGAHDIYVNSQFPSNFSQPFTPAVKARTFTPTSVSSSSSQALRLISTPLLQKQNKNTS
ncbi:coiled-coil domain-containing protein 84-like [Plakobranchus ocellatus]|uniref:Coiled-coil domain-containing protein 84-like n=1 Tax=Plakobranchus ocellatus TaxID=259542 RepID=A0AAV3XXL9_9GAST|nr:coiled-coil domain-containing protein 84-like [Plakobranchus ocellatus]